MKKIITLLLSLSLLTALTACGGTSDNSSDTGENAGETTANTSSEETDKITSTTYEVKLSNGLTVTIGGNAEDFVNAAGEPLEYTEATSCIHEGYDKVYTFDGYSVTTSPDASGNQYVSNLTLLSDVVLFDNGLSIGSGAAELDALFGTEYEEQFGVRTYTLDAVTVAVIVDGDIVTSISVNSNLN
ncbi:MAG: hypothetical protein IJY93_08530 [Clostridia bacterium]|nr:hypothetical protein [Clostridia bacterium]